MNNLEALEGTLQLAAKGLPKGYGLYDFGGDNIVAPCPDVPNDTGYLLDHLAAIERIRELPTDPSVVTAFKFDLQFVTARQIVDGMEKALERNKTQTKAFVIL